MVDGFSRLEASTYIDASAKTIYLDLLYFVALKIRRSDQLVELAAEEVDVSGGKLAGTVTANVSGEAAAL
jgi:hypothetical protein